MQVSDREKTEGLLRQLEEGGHLFRRLKLSLENGNLVLLGTGGSSYVYRMEKSDGGSEQYAVKVIITESGEAGAHERRDTCRIQWNLARESDYIVDVLDNKRIEVLVDADGRVLDAREYDDEKTEQSEETLIIQLILMEHLIPTIMSNRFHNVYLSRTSLCEESEVINFALQIGSALTTAHSYRVLHRDIKLENIFWDEGKKIYRLGDFGIARQTADGSAETVVFTGGYGAPEIVRHQSEGYDSTADIYSLGISMYLLLNDLEFPGSDGYYSRAEIQYDPEMIFAAPRHASPGMAAIIRKMCSYRPSDRYQSVCDVMRDLLALQGSEGIEVSDEMLSIVDIATATYREEKEEVNPDSEEEPPLTRAERKKEKKLKDWVHGESSIKYTLLFSLLITLFLCGAGAGWSEVKSPYLLAIPFIMLLNAIFQKLKDLNVLTGIATILFIVYSIYHTEVSAPLLAAALCVMSGSPVISLSCGIGIALWIVIGSIPTLGFITSIGRFGLCDLAFIAATAVFYVFSFIEYYCERISEKVFEIVLHMLDKLHILLIFAGVTLFVLNLKGIFTLPDTLCGLHPAVTGVVVGVVLTILYKRDELDYYSLWCNVAGRVTGDS